MKKIRVTVWNEFRHEKTNEEVKSLYPNGMHVRIAEALRECDDIEVVTAALDDPDQGLPDEVLNNTDVLFWWGHMAHGEVNDALVEKIRNRVLDGMGLVCLHSAHMSKVFTRVVGSSGRLMWGDNVHEVVWNINPTHPIAAGIPSHFHLEKEEVYAEPFQIADPDELVFLSWYDTGYVFRSGCIWKRGLGKVFYFQPGHETVPTYHNPYVLRILQNAAHYCAPAETGYRLPTTSEPCPWIKGYFVPQGELDELKK